MKRVFFIFWIWIFTLINQGIFAFSDEPVVWKKKKLTWSDFRGKAPGDPRGNSVAETSTTITFVPVEYLDGRVVVEIKAEFNPGQSWVLPGSDIPHVLNHEQRHFDLTEYCVRRIRKELKDIDNYMEVFHRITADCQKMQLHYDRDTDHGINRKKQAEWDQKIDRLLRSTEDHSHARITVSQ